MTVPGFSWSGYRPEHFAYTDVNATFFVEAVPDVSFTAWLFGISLLGMGLLRNRQTGFKV